MAEQYKFTEKYLNKYGKEVVSEIKNRLTNNATGDLKKSIKYKIDKNELTLTFYMNEYGKYIDSGVSGHGKVKGLKGLDRFGAKKTVKKGQVDKYEGRRYSYKSKMPPEDSAFKKWMKINGIDKSYSFVIRRSMWMFGIQPTNFFTIPTTRRQKQFEQGLGDAMALDIDKQLEKELK
jgi:hypothetical protein